MWLLLVADDLAMLITHSRIRESVLMVLVFFRVMGFPTLLEKVGRRRSPDMGRLRAGLAQRSVGAQRLQRLSGSKAGTEDSSETSQCRCRRSRRGWVELRSSVELWTCDRPFLAPLHAFAARHPPKQCEALSPCTRW